MIPKFRAWDKLFKQMVFYLPAQDDDNLLELPHQDRYVFMQFTGLHDCMGKEIYQGDILKAAYLHKNTFYTGEVVLQDGSFCLWIAEVYDKFNNYDVGQTPELNNFVQMDVLGNIWGHPHLLPDRTAVQSQKSEVVK